MSKSKKRLVPVRRFKEFENADAWEQRKLGDLAEIVRGASPRPIQNPKWFDDSSEIGWLRISDVTAQDGRIHRLEQHISVEGQEKTRVLTTPHLLLSIAATVGKPVINYISTGVHDGFLIFLKPRFELEFMFQWLENFRSSWQRYGQPGSQVNLNSGLVRKQTIYIPTREEQQKIAGFCEKLDNLITLHQRKLDKLKRVKSAYLTEMFPAEGEREPKRRFPGFTGAWEQRKLGDVVERFDNLRIPVTSSKRKRGITPYYGANGIQDYVQGYTHDGEFVLVAEDGANDLQNYPIHYVNGKVWVNNHAHVLQGKKDIVDNLFLVNAIKRIKFETYLVGGSRAKLNADVMMKLPIKMPKINEQQKLGKYFSRIDTLIALHQRKLDKLKKMKAAYLNEMFV